MPNGPRTITVPLAAPAPTVAFQLPPGVSLDLQSVYVDIDATGGQADPELILSEQSGVVIARKRQTGSVAAGNVGSATWALRLADETAAGTTPTPPGTELDYAPRGTPQNVTTVLVTLVTGLTLAYDGITTVQIVFFAPQAGSNTVPFREMRISLYDNGADIGTLAAWDTQGGGVPSESPVYASRFLTPSAGNHQFAVKAQGIGGAGAGGTVLAGASGGGTRMPMFMRITTA